MADEPLDFLQRRARVRLLWGRRGAQAAAAAGDLLVVVDVLSFSTGVVMAAARDVQVVPCAPGRAAAARAAELGATLAVKREVATPPETASLSPRHLADVAPGTTLVLPSPNGSTCCSLAREHGAPVLVGALVNAAATAAQVREELARDRSRRVTLLACGERWSPARDPGPSDEGMRVALEDHLGAGSIALHLEAAGVPGLSAEARAAAALVRGAGDLAALLEACVSGRELIQRGYPDDVAAAAGQDTHPVPVSLVPGGILVAVKR